MKHIINVKENKVLEVKETAEELAQKENDAANAQSDIDAKANAKAEQENVKASAKQKLMNGEALTEDEANVMVGL